MADNWRRHLTAFSSIKQEDSVEFLESALSKWRLYDARGRAVVSEQALKESIARDPDIDCLAMLSINAPWAKICDSLGICQFRRTWSHNLTIDFLAVHPALLGDNPMVSGVGTALLYRVALLAHKIRAENVWLETTDLSVSYYSYLFGLPRASDLIIIPTANFYKRLRSFLRQAN
jgi:hypothetical protein